MTYTILVVVLIITGILFVGSVLLMTPKGGLGMGIAGTSGASEYGSKKSVENTLKKVALISSILFMLTALILPYTH